MAGKGMRTKVGQVMPDGKVFCNNSMLLAAKRSHSKIEGASKALGSGSAESMATAKAAALAVAPPHVRAAAAAAKPAAKHVVMKPDFSGEKKYASGPDKSDADSRRAPYASVLDKMRNAKEYGSKAEGARVMREGMQDLRALRNQRSKEQNRSRVQGDLFSGFQAKPAKPQWEAPSAIAARKAAEEATKPKVATVDAAKPAGATNYSRMGIVELHKAMRAATGGDAAPGQLMRESRYHRQLAVTSMRDARIADAKYAALKAQYDDNVSKARGRFERDKAERGAPRNQMIDAKIAMKKALDSARENRAKAKETQAEAKRVEKAIPADMRAAVAQRWNVAKFKAEVKPRGPLPAIPKPAKATPVVAPPAPKPYRAPAENPATRKAKLGGPQDAVSMRLNDNARPETVRVKSIASSNGFHVIQDVATGKRPTFSLVGPTGYAVRRSMSKADALSLLRGGRSGKTLSRDYAISTGAFQNGSSRAHKALIRYERILAGRKAQESAARKSA